MHWKRGVRIFLLALATLGAAAAENPVQASEPGHVLVGPVNAVLLPAGPALQKDLMAPPQSPWVITGWIRNDRLSENPCTVASLIGRSGQKVLDIVIAGGELTAGNTTQRLRVKIGEEPHQWLFVQLAVAPAGMALKVGDGVQVSGDLHLAEAPVSLVLAPRSSDGGPFAGTVADFKLSEGVADTDRLQHLAPPDASLIQFETTSPSWPLQVKQYVGQDGLQDPATLPSSRSNATPPPMVAHPKLTPPLTHAASGQWRVGAWRFTAQPQTTATAAAISMPGFDDRAWLVATVPGTALTSFIDNGVYPDPAHGLNNLLVPEKLGRQDYWYRAEFNLPDDDAGEDRTLVFEGINYAAEVWVNGRQLGTLKGAFARGRFPLDATYRPGQRVAVAVRVSPPPHGGLPQEESLRAGPGQNGGQMAIDGPTFAASEGWDWIPTVRDRETGIWQDVLLEVTGPVRLGDPNIQTVLPKPNNSIAELTISVPVINQAAVASAITLDARIGDLDVSQVVQLAPNSRSIAVFAPSQYPQLRIHNPELWWPNGYGKPALQRLTLTAQTDGKRSDRREIRFGIREISYELSALDHEDALQRVAVTPDRSPGEQLIDVSHEKIRKVEGGWVVSLARDLARSPALAPASPTSLAPHLLIRVNGVPIAVRGGNWGMDDWLKRVSRERMEPYFRLHQQANANTIRNWLGQSTEQVFYDLADEYGLLVLNDFWISTQDHNGEPGDSALFLGNAADTISRFQYHPSIALWIGRNEGVPPPVLNTGLDRLVRSLDGTRLYLPNSRTVLMANSGPWNYQPPEAYFNKLAQGFSTEVGTPSFPTLETFKTMMPEADQWPISDSWAYHDWHQGKAGDVTGFMKVIADRFGAPSSLADFERKAQLLNYESHRAIFEGMNDGLFVRNSGRLLWMTHPAWPSTLWQIYSQNYDTQASYFGFKKGAEPVHVQLSLPGREVAVVNSQVQTINRARVVLRSYGLDGVLLSNRTVRLNAHGLGTTRSGLAVEANLFDRSAVVVSRLELRDAKGRLLSENTYWLGRDQAAYRAMLSMHPAMVTSQARMVAGAKEPEVRVTLHNESAVPALMVRLSAIDAGGGRVLPAYWSDNYISLLPDETRTIGLVAPRTGAKPATIGIDGWNIANGSVPVVSGPNSPSAP